MYVGYKTRIIFILTFFFAYVFSFLFTFASSTYNTLPEDEINSLVKIEDNILSYSYSSIDDCNNAIEKYNLEYSNKSRSICFKNSDNDKFYYIICNGQNQCNEETEYIINYSQNSSLINNSQNSSTNNNSQIISQNNISSVGINGFEKFPGCDKDSRLEGDYLVSGCYSNFGTPDYTFNNIGYYYKDIYSDASKIEGACPDQWELIPYERISEGNYKVRNFDNIWPNVKPGVVTDSDLLCYGEYYCTFTYDKNYDRFKSVHRTSSCYDDIKSTLYLALPDYYPVICVKKIDGNDSQINSCAIKPSYSHAIFVEGTATSVNQSWQNINSNNACYYYCETGYSGDDCSTYNSFGNSNYPGCDTPDIVLGNGQVWSACNVGATKAGTGTESYGQYFQWGRNKGFDFGDLSYQTDKIKNYDKDNDNALYVKSDDYVWLEDGNNNFWNLDGADKGRQGVCADGYHIPTIGEYEDATKYIMGFNELPDSILNSLGEDIDFFDNNLVEYVNVTLNSSSKLKPASKVYETLLLPFAGNIGPYGYSYYGGKYWSTSTLDGSYDSSEIRRIVFEIEEYVVSKGVREGAIFSSYGDFLSSGNSVRCIRNGSSTSVIQRKSCAAKPNYSHAIFVEGTAINLNQSWQNTNSNNACYYYCETGYSGDYCEIINDDNGSNMNNNNNSNTENSGWIWVKKEGTGITPSPAPLDCSSRGVKEGDVCTQGTHYCPLGNGYNLYCENKGFYMESYGESLSNCTSSSSDLTHIIHNTDGDYKGCQEYVLTAEGREGESRTCTKTSDFITVNWVMENYDSSTNTTSSYVKLKDHPTYVPGKYRGAALLPSGEIVYGNWYTIDSPNGKDCKVSSNTTNYNNNNSYNNTSNSSNTANYNNSSQNNNTNSNAGWKWVKKKNTWGYASPMPAGCSSQGKKEGTSCTKGDSYCILGNGYDLYCKNEGVYIESSGTSLNNCTVSTSDVRSVVYNTDGNIKLCGEYELTSIGREGESHYCTKSSDFIDAWAKSNYNSSTNTTSSYVKLQNHNIYVTGRYRLVALLPSGEIVYGNWYTIDSPNGKDCKVSSNTTNNSSNNTGNSSNTANYNNNSSQNNNTNSNAGWKWVKKKNTWGYASPMPAGCSSQGKKEGTSCTKGDSYCILGNGYDLYCKNEGVYIESSGTSLNNCTVSTSDVRSIVYNTDGNIKLCGEYELTSIGREGESHYCTKTSDFIDAWAKSNYNSSTNTTSSYVKLQNHNIYVTGKYRLAALLPNGEIVYGNWYTIDSPNLKDCKVSSNTSNSSNTTNYNNNSSQNNNTNLNAGWKWVKKKHTGGYFSPMPADCSLQGKKEGKSCTKGDSYCPLGDGYDLVCKSSGLYIESYGKALNSCTQFYSDLTHVVHNTDGNIKLCQEYKLTAKGRYGESHYCTKSSDFVSGWVKKNYNSSSNTTSSYVKLQNHPAYVPGEYRLVVLLPSGEMVYGNWYTIGSLNLKDCKVSSDNTNSVLVNEDIRIKTYGSSLNNCTSSSSDLTHDIFDTDGNIKLCQEYVLTAKGREGESRTCTKTSDFIDAWAKSNYNSSTNTTSSYVKLKDHPTYVPGKYRLAALLPSGKIVYGNWYTIDSSNGKRCKLN